jgi:trans-2,3-dihydro-3-hydroxyanthranilate isomerase
VIDVNVSQTDGKPDLIQFTMETKPVIDRYVPKEEQNAEVLSLIEEDIDNKKFNPLLVYSDQSYLVVPVKTYSAVRAAKFNFTAWSRSMASACMANEILLFST